MNILKNSKVVLAKAGQTSAGTAVDSDAIDTSGYDGVVFVGTIATANAGNFAKVAQSGDSGGSPDDFSDLTGTKVVTGDNGDSFAIEVVRPQKRYVRCTVIRAGANTATGDIYAILYGARKQPVTHGTTVDSEVHASPSEGTA